MKHGGIFEPAMDNFIVGKSNKPYNLPLLFMVIFSPTDRPLSIANQMNF